MLEIAIDCLVDSLKAGNSCYAGFAMCKLLREFVCDDTYNPRLCSLIGDKPVPIKREKDTLLVRAAQVALKNWTYPKSSSRDLVTDIIGNYIHSELLVVNCARKKRDLETMQQAVLQFQMREGTLDYQSESAHKKRKL